MSIIELPRAIHPGIPAEDYHARVLGVVNKGALDQIAKTPAHYRSWLVEPQPEETPALKFGKALHARIMEPERFSDTYIAEQKHQFRRLTDAQRNAKKPSDETLRAIEYWDAWAVQAAGKIEFSAEDATKLEGMRDSIMAHPIASKLFVNGIAEATAVWDEGGLVCKSRMDYWRADLGVIADLKTTEDARPGAFARSVAAYRYAVQHAHYCAGVGALTGSVPSFLFVAVEKSPPYAVAVYQLDAESIAKGHELRDRDMARLDECLQSDQWPGYPTGVTSLSLPNWALKEAA